MPLAGVSNYSTPFQKMVLCLSVSLMMMRIMTRLTYRDEPFNGLFANVMFCIFLVMDLRCTCTTVYAAPLISLKYYIALPPPII